MSFRYRPSNDEGSQGQHWATYSDLFMALSVVFLLLYVVASVNTGAFGVQQSLEYQQLAKEAEDLRQQIRVYNTLKDDYLKKGATQDEVETYEQLMSKLELLQEENREEQSQLLAQANENKQKEQALNQYQQMIRNIINNNMISQGRIQRRDQVIQEKDEVIVEKQESIDNQLTAIRILERETQDKQRQIETGQQQITQAQKDLSNKEKALEQSLKKQQISKAAFEERMKKIREESQEEISQMKQKHEQNQSELSRMSSRLAKVNSDLMQAQDTITSQQEEKETLVESLQKSQQEAQDQMRQIQTQFEVQQRLQQRRFEDTLAKEKLNAQQRAAREKEHQQAMAAQKQNLEQKVSALQKGIQDSQGELAKAQEQLRARQKLASQIAENMKKAGVHADVDQRTGDVVLSFGRQYFDTGRADLKPEMIKKLQDFVPVYSQSLFQDKNIAKKIGSVEIVGFASPTYKGRYVDPASLNPQDREAVTYNLDLSYSRARSIFEHIFDTSKMSYKHQQNLLPLVKVTGRSFLAEGVQGRNVASGISVQEYCAQHDCEQSQRVIIKFNLKD